MKKLWILPITLIALGILMLIVDITAVKEKKSLTAEPNRADTPHQSHTDSSTQKTPAPKEDPRLNRLASGAVEYKPALTVSRQIRPDNKPRDNIAHIEQLLGHYRFAYKENPVGVENFEITEQLLGNNPKQIIFIAADSPALRGNELVDQWGTPYFYHALSGQEMEVRSAGPDEELWTADDFFSDEKAE